MGGYESRPSLLALPVQYGRKLAYGGGIQRDGRVVQNYRLCALGQADCERHTLAHALGVSAQFSLAGALEADEFDEFIDAAPAGAAVEAEDAAVEVQRLFGVEEAIEVRFFGEEADQGM